MQFGHEQLDVYRLAIDYVAWSCVLAKELNGVDRHARDQLFRAAQSIPLNIAEGNGKGTKADRRRFFEIARGSAMECAAIQDCLEACQVLSRERSGQGKAMLIRDNANDSDNDYDNEEDEKSKPCHATDG
jgi:four helix bundle protein